IVKFLLNAEHSRCTDGVGADVFERIEQFRSAASWKIDVQCKWILIGAYAQRVLHSYSHNHLRRICISEFIFASWQMIGHAGHVAIILVYAFQMYHGLKLANL